MVNRACHVPKNGSTADVFHWPFCWPFRVEQLLLSPPTPHFPHTITLGASPGSNPAPLVFFHWEISVIDGSTHMRRCPSRRQPRLEGRESGSLVLIWVGHRCRTSATDLFLGGSPKIGVSSAASLGVTRSGVACLMGSKDCTYLGVCE
jgi:hypothetical protein